jgi:hypothetical protein
MTSQERLARIANESASYVDGEQLRSAFAISDIHVITAWHCVADNFDQRVWFRLRQQASAAPRYLYVPLRLTNFSVPIDIAVLTVDESGLAEVNLTAGIARAMLRAAAIRLSGRVRLHDQVRVIGFPASASSADNDANAATVVDLDLAVGNTMAVKLYGDAFAAVDPVNPRGLSGGPVLRQEAGRTRDVAAEEAVAVSVRCRVECTPIPRQVAA